MIRWRHKEIARIAKIAEIARIENPKRIDYAKNYDRPDFGNSGNLHQFRHCFFKHFLRRADYVFR